ncbi:hypothetical protein CR513_22964, partial [Mucuna pruriens]
METYPASKSHPLLHSVRKSQAKPWKKSPVAPPAPTPIRVYKVDAINFRCVVQQLTGAPEFKPQLHNQFFQSVTPTPPNIDIAASSTVSTNWYQGMESQGTAAGAKGFLELNLSSPSSYNWCMSQGTITSLEQGRVL